ncbi:carboxymuconolactone decarboxylase family protein [Phascolarctobacterium succinatutens]|uniref:carboxymuconolactone decarboxylase family protein n=1 Tax=Phascolarctobacterium succinatutens TaxID=626940 RepID=UPI0026EDB091|nr:carboxymuconolactone decarboxylase family protein [Phascolarctobacterium succinatutens]
MNAMTNFIKKCLPAVALISSSFFFSPVYAQDTMTFQEIYSTNSPVKIQNEPELSHILNNLIYTDVQKEVSFTPAQQELLTLAVLTALNTPQEITAHVQGALKAGATPEQIHEAIMHTTPYVGYPRSKAALTQMHKAFKKAGVKMPLAKAGTVTEATRFDKGLEKQVEVAGERIITGRKTAPADQMHINDFLAANCFGDYYTREILNMQERELLTFAAIISLGGADPQARGHVAANIKVGNTRKQLLDVITVALPYIGYPRTLNALAAINSVMPAK